MSSTSSDHRTRGRRRSQVRRWSRRAILRAAGIALPLPCLTSLQHRLFGREAAAAAIATVPKRFLCVHFSYGMRPEHWWPTGDAQNWQSMPSLAPLTAHRGDITLLRGISLVRGTTHGVHGQPYQFLNADRLSKVSMDQLLADDMSYGGASRYQSLETGGEATPEGIAFTREGVPLPTISDARQLYEILFRDGRGNLEATLARLGRRRSMLDALTEDLRDVERHLDAADRRKLDEYLSSIRLVERKIEKTEAWLNTPKPSPTTPEPEGNPSLERYRELADVFLELIMAAFATDQTRVASFFFSNNQIPLEDGGSGNYHAFTHHNGDTTKLEALARADVIRNEAFSELLRSLAEKRDADGSRMLDNTLVLYGSATEDAARHQGVSLPLVLAGRPDILRHGAEHGGMLEFDSRSAGMSDLLLTLLRAQGISVESFGESTTQLPGLLRG